MPARPLYFRVRGDLVEREGFPAPLALPVRKERNRVDLANLCQSEAEEFSP